MSEYNKSEKGVVHTPSRRLFLGTVVAGSTVGLGGCSLFDTLFGDAFSSNSNKKSRKVVKGKSKKSTRKIAKKRYRKSKSRSLGLSRNGGRQLAFHNTHTGERLRVTYWENGKYQRDALREINHLLRDHRRNEVRRIDRNLIDQLFAIRKKLGTSRPMHVISGYRSPKTNAMLRKKGHRGVAKRSLHMSGRAIDIRVPGRSLNRVRLAALSVQGGGVGYYPGPNFVHLDTGRVRRW